MKITSRRLIATCVAAIAAAYGGFRVSSAQSTGTQGPSSSATPYVVGVAPGVTTRSILTVGDSVNTKPDGSPYRMVGIPDGLGAFDNGDGTFTVLMNHELRGPINETESGRFGAIRAHGASGAFVSKYIVNKSDLSVVRGDDLVQRIGTWDTATSSYREPRTGVVMQRLCSADLPDVSAFFDAASGLGTQERIFMNGEEIGPEGKAYGHLMNGTTYELPRLGKFSWENSVANPATGVKTVVVGTDDATPGQVYVYVGNKTNSGTPVDHAGLTNGLLYGVKVLAPNGAERTTRFENDANSIPSGSPFVMASLGNVENETGASQQLLSAALNITEFARPEDGAWDPSNPNDFYFVTTGASGARSRLFRLRFADRNNPEQGGTIDELLNGTEVPAGTDGYRSLDNLTINKRGQILIQEDPGASARIARLWRYNIAGDNLNLIAQHDPARFTPTTGSFAPLFNNPAAPDEESSGIIDMTDILGEGTYLLDVQAHYERGIDEELVEGGQLLLLQIPTARRR